LGGSLWYSQDQRAVFIKLHSHKFLCAKAASINQHFPVLGTSQMPKHLADYVIVLGDNDEV
jgi:hypothetical protein